MTVEVKEEIVTKKVITQGEWKFVLVDKGDEFTKKGVYMTLRDKTGRGQTIVFSSLAEFNSYVQMCKETADGFNQTERSEHGSNTDNQP